MSSTRSLPHPSDRDVPCSPESIAAAKLDACAQLKALAERAASLRGHVLGSWHEGAEESDVAYCQTCRRSAVINIVRDPHLAGAALAEPCGSPVGRPDAFLASQHPADLDARRI